MDKSASCAEKDIDMDAKREEMDSIMGEILAAPSPPSESPNEETIPTSENSTVPTKSVFRQFLEFLAEYLLPIYQLLLRWFNKCKMHKSKDKESIERKVSLLLTNNESFKSKYKVDCKLGSGAFGIVYKVTPKFIDKELEPLALKVLCEDLSCEPHTTFNEIQKNVLLCQRSSCPNVVSFFSFNVYTCQLYRYLCLEMELCDGGSLKKSEFHEHKYSTDTFRRKVLEDVISGMIFIHKCGVVHWDIHGDNVLFKSPEDDTLKFGDFGLTRESPSTQNYDVRDLGRTLLKWVFLRESKLFGDEGEIKIMCLLIESGVPKDMRDILEGLTFNTMSLSEAQRKVIEMQEKDSPDGIEDPVDIRTSDQGISSNNNLTANSVIRKKRTGKEILKIDPFYPQNYNGEFLQPEDLLHFIIVYPKDNYADVKAFMSWFKMHVEEDTGIEIEIKLYDDEGFPSDRVLLAKEIYDRAMFVLFYLTHEFREDKCSSFVSSEGIGQTKFQYSTKLTEKFIYSSLAQKHKTHCRRPIHTMPEHKRNYETPSGLTTIKAIDYFDTSENADYLRERLRALGQSAEKMLNERREAMQKCLYDESSDMCNVKKYASESTEAMSSDASTADSMSLQVSSASSLRSNQIEKAQTGDGNYLEVNKKEERIVDLASEVSGPSKAEEMQRSTRSLEIQNQSGGDRMDEGIKGDELLIKIIQCFKNEATSSQRPLDIAKKCIGGQSRKKDVNPYLYHLQKAGFLEVTYSTERRTDPRYQATDKLNSIADDRITVIASELCSTKRSGSLRRVAGQEDRNHSQERVKNEQQAQIPLLVNDVEILFDYLSRKLPARNLQHFCIVLLGDSTIVDSCNTKYIPDIFFKVMNSWKCKIPKIDHVKELKEVLLQLERQDLVDDIHSFSVQSFCDHTLTIEGPKLFASDSDFRQISRNIAQRYVHVVRFLGLPQSFIDQLEINFAGNIEEQIYQAFKKIQCNFPNLNRQHICDALHYADHSDVILLLNEMWMKAT